MSESNGKAVAVVKTAQNSVLVRMAERFKLEPAVFAATVKATCMPNGGQGVTNEQFAAFLLVADQYGLNPLTKEVHAFSGKGGGVVPIVGIDGWYKLMNSHPQFDGIEFEDTREAGKLVSVTAKIHRKDRAHPTSVTEYMSECVRGTDPWKQWPARMLRHKAAIQCARAAFGFSGIVDPDEGERIVATEVQATVERKSATNLEEFTAQLAESKPAADLADVAVEVPHEVVQ